MTVVETTQYLTFKLEGQIFALDISKVREAPDFTAIANFVKDAQTG